MSKAGYLHELPKVSVLPITQMPHSGQWEIRSLEGRKFLLWEGWREKKTICKVVTLFFA